MGKAEVSLPCGQRLEHIREQSKIVQNNKRIQVEFL